MRRHRMIAIGCLASCFRWPAPRPRTGSSGSTGTRAGRGATTAPPPPGPGRSARTSATAAPRMPAARSARSAASFALPPSRPTTPKAIPAAIVRRRPLTASGTLAMDGRPTHGADGFFNSGTLNEWRTPNTIALRISGRGDLFYAWVEYATARWRAGGDEPRGFPTRSQPQTGRQGTHRFRRQGCRASLVASGTTPRRNGGVGVDHGDHRRPDGRLPSERKATRRTERSSTASGILTVMKSGGRRRPALAGRRDDRRRGTKTSPRDPGWEGFQNRVRLCFRERPTSLRFRLLRDPVRGRHRAAGRIRRPGLPRATAASPARMACYGDHLGGADARQAAAGLGPRLPSRDGVTDSTALIGFYHSRRQHEVATRRRTPACRRASSASRWTGPAARASTSRRPIAAVMPAAIGSPVTGRPASIRTGCPTTGPWTIRPRRPAAGAGSPSRWTGRPCDLDLGDGARVAGARFDRFGIITTWIDGNGQAIYFDDLTYTCTQ